MKSILRLPILLCLILLMGHNSGLASSINSEMPQQRTTILTDPLSASLMEFPTQALPLWRKHKTEKPVLILLSQDPLMQFLPTTIQRSLVAQLEASESGPPPRLNPLTADPLLLPRMTIRAGIEAGYFSQIFWVFPSRSNSQLDLELFRQQLIESNALNKTEAESLSVTEQHFTGQVAATPFQAGTLENLAFPRSKSLLHIDLSYFKPLYRGEIKTPLYELLYQTLKQLRQQQLSAAAVSISLSSLDGNLPLSTRFIGATLARLFAEPHLLEQPLSEDWEIRRKALYLGNFFQNEKIRELYLQLKKRAPQDSSVHYALYQTLRKLKQGTAALESLTEAVQLDLAYGLEYLTLADTALGKDRPDQALKMFERAAAAFPDNPFIPLQKADTLIKLGHTEPAVKLLQELRQQPWSKTYYPQLPEYIESLLAAPVSD